MKSRWGRRGWVFAGVLLLVSGCATGASRTEGRGQTAASRTAAAPAPSPGHSPPPSPTPPPAVTLAFGGDVHFEGEIATRLAADPRTALGPIAPVLRHADLAMVNLETAVTSGGDRATKTYAFRAPATAFESLKAAGVDIVTMANNHGMDYGRAGLADSLAAARRHGMPVVGAGEDAARAYAPHLMHVHGQRIAVIGATQVLDSNLVTAWSATDTQPGLASAKPPHVTRLLAAVRSARAGADTVVVYLHWGYELRACPLDRQRRLARQLIDAGADVIVGSHAHRLLAGGFLEGRYVDFGLGNFVFYNYDSVTGRTGVLELTLRGRRVVDPRWVPAQISGGVPLALHGQDARQARAQWRELRSCTELKASPQ